MYCPHCGTENADELNFCKRCGGNLNLVAVAPAGETRPAPVHPATAWAVGMSTFMTVVGGLLVLFIGLNVMATNREHLGPLVPIALFGALTILGSVTLLTSLWTRLLARPGAEQPALPKAGWKSAAPGEVGAPRFGALPPESFNSVTEGTTRTLEVQGRRRKAEG